MKRSDKIFCTFIGLWIALGITAVTFDLVSVKIFHIAYIISLMIYAGIVMRKKK